MIPTDVYIEYLKNALKSQKSTYDYLQLILPIVSGFVLAITGWFFAIFQNSKNTIFQLKKEQYYRSRESMTKIITLFSEYLTYIYNFIKNTKNKFNSGETLDIDLLDDFITENQMKLAFIHQLIKIEFPFTDTSSKEISNEIKKIEDMFSKLKELQNRLLNRAKNDSIEKINDEITKLHSDSAKTVDKITEIISVVEIKIIRSLENDAKKLNIAKPLDEKKIPKNIK